MKGEQLESRLAELDNSFSGIPLERMDKPASLNCSQPNNGISNFGLLNQSCLQYFDKQALFGYIKLLEDLVKRLRENSSAETQPKEVTKDPVKSKVNEVTSNLTRNSSWHNQGSPCKFIYTDTSRDKAQAAKKLNTVSKVELPCKYFTMNLCTFGKSCRYVHSPLQSKVKMSEDNVCTYCNLWHVSKKACPALGKKCHRCKKLNHFSAVCRTKQSRLGNKIANSGSSDVIVSIQAVMAANTQSRVTTTWQRCCVRFCKVFISLL